MNMDYALCQALKNTMTDNEKRVIFVYDINCQYMVNLTARIKRGAKHLWIKPGLLFMPGIGLFHVHGHRDICFPRFAPTFIPGAGQTDGEILETLWAVLNEVGRTTRTMTLAHRSEVLDAHMLDNNWKKMINMGIFVLFIFLLIITKVQSAVSARSGSEPRLGLLRARKLSRN
jgi:hypothetical protein